MKKSLLKSLLTLGVTKEDAQEYIVLLEKREQKRNPKKIETLLPVAYLSKNGTLECLPYIDPARKADIIGIKVESCVWLKETSGENVTFYEATKMAAKAGCELPSASDFNTLICSHQDWIDPVITTISELRKVGIDISLPAGRTSFWSREKAEDGESIKVFNLYDNACYSYDPTKRTAHAHFVRYV